MPTVQLSAMTLPVTVVLSVWFLKIRPVRLSSNTLSVNVLPLLLLTSIPVRFPTNFDALTVAEFV